MIGRKSHNTYSTQLQQREHDHEIPQPSTSRSSRISTPLTKDADIARLLSEERNMGSRGSRKSQTMDDAIFAESEEELCGSVLKDQPPVKKIPRDKQMHMDGILHGLPGMKTPAASTAQDAYVYCEEMKKMGRGKDMKHFRTRDQYSDYVEARARFGKMHSVN